MSMARNQATAPFLSACRLAARSGSGLVSGIFLDSNGLHAGFFQVSVSTAGWTPLEPPPEAVGAVISTAPVDLIITPVNSLGEEPDIADALTLAPYHTQGTRNIALGVVAS